MKSTAPTRYIALLRAINVGGHTVKMGELGKLFEQIGFEDVETFIASGNVIFSSPEVDAGALEKKIERHLKAELGYEVATLIRSTIDIGQVAEYEPFPGEDVDGVTLYVAFLPSELSAEARDKIEALGTPTDEFHVYGRELYWLCRTRISDSKISGAMLEKVTGAPMTMRNVTTVRKLAARYPQQQARGQRSPPPDCGR